ncbi:hypothetical protein [Trueperella abortisuis]|uniref:hypothetical protein n=1 Tax=Trueperella abortisuis TaxID=445930 RepID=UPI0028935F4A|nr:hypothetical protein [Trueperella abortisuis]
MIAKLLKHEFVRTRALLGVIFGAALASVALGCVLLALGIPVLEEFGAILSLLPVIVLVPAVQILMAVDFWRSSFRSQGYLTHAIPVKGATIYWTKLLWQMIVTAVAIVVGFLLLALVWFVLGTAGLEFFAAEPNLFTLVGNVLGAAGDIFPVPVLYGVIIPLLLLAAFFQWPVYYTFAASVGSAGSLGRMGGGGPVIAAIVAWLASQVIIFLALVVVPFGIDMTPVEAGDAPEFIHFNIARLIASGSNSDIIPLGVFAGLAIMLVAYLWLSQRSWNKKVELN